MRFDDIREKYTRHELSYCPGDSELRFKIFSPFLSGLYQNKIVYCERFVCIASLRDIEQSPEGFSATCIPVLPLQRAESRRPEVPDQEWRFGGPWHSLALCGNAINFAYGGWSIWPEADRVKEVIRLMEAGDLEATLKLTVNEPC